MAAPATYVSFFSGIAGLDIAVRRVFRRARCLMYVENEVAAAARLAARMEDGSLDPAPIWGDVGTVPTGLFRGRIDMAVGGFPCQDLSLAGKRAGINGARSGLFFALLRAIRDMGCRYLFLENVSAITVGRELDAVLGALAEIGFAAEWGCLRAADVGAPHGRDRWWCLAWDREQVADAARVGGAQQSCIDDARRPLGGSESGTGGRVVDGHLAARVRQSGGVEGAIKSHVAYPGSGSCQPKDGHAAIGRWARDAQQTGVGCSKMGDPERQSLALGGCIGRDVREEQPAAERAGNAILEHAARIGAATGLQGRLSVPAEPVHRGGGLPDWPPGPDDRNAWTTILERWPHLAPAVVGPVRRVADGVPVGLDVCLCSRGDRLRGLGNAVVPQQAEAALRLLWFRAFGEWP